MAGHSILYLGSDGFAPEYLANLQARSCCNTLFRSTDLSPPDKHDADLVLFEAGSGALKAAHGLQAEARVVALSTRGTEVVA